MPQFGSIALIRCCSGEVQFVIRLCNTVGFSKHFGSYTIEEKEPEFHKCYEISSISNPLTHVFINNEMHVANVGIF